MNRQRVAQVLMRAAAWGFLISSLLSIVIYMYQGQYVRYFADDYNAAEVLVRQGFWNTQTYWYSSWTGSYSFTFLISLSASAGVSMVQWLPVLSLGVWVTLLWQTFRMIFKVLNMPIGNITVGILSSVIVFCTIKSFQDYTQIIFWQTGIIAYQSNNIIFLAIVIYFSGRFYLSTERPLAGWEYIAMFIAFFITGGLGETWVVMQITLFILGILASLLSKGPMVLNGFFRMSIIGVFASCVSLLVTLGSPGNVNHSPAIGSLSLGLILKSFAVSLGDVPHFLFGWLIDHTVLFALLTLTAFICGACLTENSRLTLKENIAHLRLSVFIFIGASIMLWAGFFPGYVAFGVRPPSRAIFSAMFIFLSSYGLLCLCAGYIVNSLLTMRWHSWIRITLLAGLAWLMYLSPLQTAYSQAGLIPVFQKYAQLWDSRDAFLRHASEQGQTDVTVQSLRLNPDLQKIKSTIWLVGELEEDPANWKNQAAANYYGLKSITGQK